MMDWKTLSKDRRAQLGAAAVVVAAFAWWRHRKAAATGTTSGSSSTALPAAAGGSAGTYDTTGTDIASWLGNYSSNLQSQLTGYQTNEQQTLSQIQTAAGVGQPRVYTVTQADTGAAVDAGGTTVSGGGIWGIAHRFGFGGQSLINANNGISTVKPGQQIIIPAAVAKP